MIKQKNSEQEIPRESTIPTTTVSAVESKAKVVSKKRPAFLVWWREIVLTLVNVIFVVATFVYLAKLPQRANQVKEYRNSVGFNKAALNLDLSKFEVESSKEKFDSLNAIFPDQKKLLDFIGEVDKLKVSGNVINFAFASESAVKEKSGYLGYPFVIEFEGALTEVTNGLEKFEKLPFVFKPINFSLTLGEEVNQVLLRYGGFLYVSETTSKN